MVIHAGEYRESLGRPKAGSVFGRWMNNLRCDHITREEEGNEMEWLACIPLRAGN